MIILLIKTKKRIKFTQTKFQVSASVSAHKNFKKFEKNFKLFFFSKIFFQIYFLFPLLITFVDNQQILDVFNTLVHTNWITNLA